MVRMKDGRLLNLKLREAKVSAEGERDATRSLVALETNPEGAPTEFEPKQTEADRKWEKHKEELIRQRIARAEAAQRAAFGQPEPQ